MLIPLCDQIMDSIRTDLLMNVLEITKQLPFSTNTGFTNKYILFGDKLLSLSKRISSVFIENISTLLKQDFLVILSASSLFDFLFPFYHLQLIMFNVLLAFKFNASA